ncbi:hypothetical protein Ddc_17270 [Ditylenchus destructor]|nr:hypothetical protein Ddc_17270 [Ditylenchus destructor]
MHVPVDVFAFCSRRTLANHQLVSREFHKIIAKYFSKYPFIRLHWVSIEHGRLHLKLDASQFGYYSSSTKTLAQLIPPFSVGPEDSDFVEKKDIESEGSNMGQSLLPEAFSISPDCVPPYVRFDNFTITLDDCFTMEALWNKILKHEHLFKPRLPCLFIVLKSIEWWKHWDTVCDLNLHVDHLRLFFLQSASFYVPSDFSFFNSAMVQECKHLYFEGVAECTRGFIKCQDVADWLNISPSGDFRQLAVMPGYLKERPAILQQLLVQAFQQTSLSPTAHDYICFLYEVYLGQYQNKEFRREDPLIHPATTLKLHSRHDQIHRTAKEKVFKSPQSKTVYSFAQTKDKRKWSKGVDFVHRRTPASN